MSNRTRQWNAEGTEGEGEDTENTFFSLPLFSSAPSALKIQLLSWLRLRRAMRFVGKFFCIVTAYFKACSASSNVAQVIIRTLPR